MTTFSDNSIGIFAQGGVWGASSAEAWLWEKARAQRDPSVQSNAVNGSIIINDGGSLLLNGGGDVVLENGDCAEDFAFTETSEPEPGTVMVLDESGEGASLLRCIEYLAAANCCRNGKATHPLYK